MVNADEKLDARKCPTSPTLPAPSRPPDRCSNPSNGSCGLPAQQLSNCWTGRGPAGKPWRPSAPTHSRQAKGATNDRKIFRPYRTLFQGHLVQGLTTLAKMFRPSGTGTPLFGKRPTNPILPVQSRRLIFAST